MVVQTPQVIEHAPNSIIQELYLNSWVEECGGFGKKGWGKSWAVLHEPLGDIHHPDFSGILFRRTYQDLADLWNKSRLHYAGYDIARTEKPHLVTWPAGARYLFTHLNHPKDVYTHNGQEYQLIVFDELPQFPASVYLFMIMQLRGTNPEIMQRIRVTGNWKGEGLLFAKGRFYDRLRPTRLENGILVPGDIGWFKSVDDIDMRAPPEIERDLFQLVAENPNNWRQVKAKEKLLAPWMSREWLAGDYKDNPHLMAGTPDYEAKLEQLPEELKRVYMFGEAEQFDQDGQLILGEWWETAISGFVKWNGEKRWNGAGDYAPGGRAPGAGDNCVKFWGQGNRVEDCEWGPGRATVVYAKEIEKFTTKYGYQGLFGFDANGPGVGVWDYIRIHLPKSRDKVIPLVEMDVKFKARGIPMYRFDCLRSQMQWAAREDLEAGLLDLSWLKRRPDILQKIQPQALAHTFKVLKGGFVRVISKADLKKSETLGESPDFWDALVMWNWIRRKPKDFRVSLPKTKDPDYDLQRGDDLPREKGENEAYI